MKRASSAHRLAFILFSAALTSIALAAPPQHAQGEPPPFSDEDCVFEHGRTVCEIVEAAAGGEAKGSAFAQATEQKCADGSTLYEIKMPVSKVITTTRVVFRGTSNVVLSFEVFTEQIDGDTVLDTACW